MPPSTLTPAEQDKVRAACRENLSEKQREFLDAPIANGRLNMLVAVAGSGKSTTVAATVAQLMIDPKVSSIMCLTSTRSAASTLLAKIEEVTRTCGLVGMHLVFPSQSVRTIHSVALEENRRSSSGRRLEVITDTDVRTLARKVLDELLDPHRLESVGVSSWEEYWAKSLNDTALSEQRAAVDKKNKESTDKGRALYKTIYPGASEKPVLQKEWFLEKDEDAALSNLIATRKEIIDRLGQWDGAGRAGEKFLKMMDEEMNQKGLVDHSKSIRMYADSEEAVCGEGCVLVIDEAQDNTMAQVKIAATALKAGCCVLYVGDPSQGIMRFAGAHTNPMQCMWNEAKKHNGLTSRFQLALNFRSTKQILACSEAVLPEEDQQLRGCIEAKCFGAPVWVLKGPRQGKSEAELVAEHIKAALNDSRNSRKPGEIAVTRFTNWDWKSDLVVALKKEGVPFYIVGEPVALTSPPARLLSFLKIFVGLDKFENGVEKQALLLQLGVRALQEATKPAKPAKKRTKTATTTNKCAKMTDDVVDMVLQVSRAKQVGVVDAFLDEDAMKEVMLVKSPDTYSDKKRDANGKPVRKHNTRLYNLQNAQESLRIAKERAQRLIKDARTVSSAACSVYSELIYSDDADNAGNDSFAELKPVLDALDALQGTQTHVGTDGLPLADLSAAIAAQWEELVCLDKRVAVSTFHKFKGKERERVYCMELSTSFDFVRPSDAALMAYEASHEADCPQPRTLRCTCQRFLACKEAVEEEMEVERRRLAHVALSRAKSEMVLSYSGMPSRLLEKAFATASKQRP